MENRPGANLSSTALLDFTLARFIRLRMQGLHTTINYLENNVQWLADRTELNKRSFYSLQNIKIGARLQCNGHASKAIADTIENEVSNSRIQGDFLV